MSHKIRILLNFTIILESNCKKQHSDLKSLMIVFFFFATPVIQVTQILSQSKVAYEKRSCMFVQNLQKEIND